MTEHLQLVGSLIRGLRLGFHILPFVRNFLVWEKSCRAAQSIPPTAPSAIPDKRRLQTDTSTGRLTTVRADLVTHAHHLRHVTCRSTVFLYMWSTCVSNSDTSRLSLFRCLFTNVINVWKQKRKKAVTLYPHTHIKKQQSKGHPGCGHNVLINSKPKKDGRRTDFVAIPKCPIFGELLYTLIILITFICRFSR